MSAILVGYLIAMPGYLASFYLWVQWFVYPKLRRRLRVCKPFLAIGWGMWLVGASVLAPYGKQQHSYAALESGALIAIVGIGLVVYASIRLLRSNAAERKVARGSSLPQSEGVWPPPPNIPAG